MRPVQLYGKGNHDTSTNENEDIFWELWEQHREKLFQVCLNIMKGSVEDARDALSSSILTAREKFPQNADKIHNIKGWFFSLTRNTCIDILRKRKKENTYLYKLENTLNSNKRIKGGPLHFESSEETAYREEVLNLVFDAIKKLPRQLREPALLRFFLKMPYQEIAAHCNLSVVNARKRLQEVRTLLFNELQNGSDFLTSFLMLKNNNKSAHFSSTWSEAVKESQRIIERNFQELNCKYTASNIVQLVLPSGTLKHSQVFFNANINRQRIRVKTLQNYVNCYPGGWKKRMELAELLYATGDWEKAIEEFRQVLQKHPQSLGAWIQLAEMLKSIDQQSKAVKVLEEAQDYSRKDATKHHLNGLIQLYRDQFAPAVTSFKKAAEMEETNAVHHQRLAMVYSTSDRPLDAVKSFEKALQIDDKDLFSLTNNYDSLVTAGRLKKAELYVEKALEIFPDDIIAIKHKMELRCRRGQVWGQEGKITRALIRKITNKAPWAAEIQEAQAIYHFYRGEFKKGLQLLKHFAEDKKNDPYAWHAYGHWLYRTDSYQEAADAILKSFRLYDKTPRLHCNLFEILTRAGKKEQLKNAINRMYQFFPDHWSVCSSIGQVLAFAYGENDRALRLTARAVELQPELPEAYFRHGRVLSLTGTIEEAIDVMLKGWKSLPVDDSGLQSVPAAWRIAQCYKSTGNGTQARKWFNILIQRADHLSEFNPAAAYYWTGKAHYELGNAGETSECLRSALSFQLFYPHRRDAKTSLKRLATYKTKPR